MSPVPAFCSRGVRDLTPFDPPAPPKSSGEFVHAAPWSTGDQGRDNVSHGCVGMSMSNAIWLFNRSTVGDIVKVVGSSRPLEPGNGYTDWNVSWSDWLAGSALQS